MPENEEINGKKRKTGPKKRDLMRANTVYSDGELAEKSRVWRLFFIERQPDFVAIDASLGGTFANDWLAAIETFEAMTTTENLLDEQRQYALDLEDARQSFLKAFQLLDYYLPKAYPDMDGMREEFGLNKILTRDYQRGVRQVVLGYAILIVTDERQALLTAAGLPATWQADTMLLLEKYGELEVLYERQKLKTTTGSNERVRQYNRLFKIHRQIAKAADVIYANDKVVAELFR